MGVDHTNVASNSGSKNVRIVSKKAYDHGLFILDLAHMPGGICGTWPVYWMVGPNWPNSGEIDIIEGVHTATNNAMTLHSSDGCGVADDSAFSGVLTTTNCYIYAAGQVNNAGCDIQDPRSNSYGTNFKPIGGGIFATEWTSSDINVWFFPRGSILANVQSSTPDPTAWGRPITQFQGACDLDAHFQNQQIIFDDTFCGDWAGKNNQSAFTNAYWLINSLKVYQSSGTPAEIKPSVAAAAHRELVNATAPIDSAPLTMGGGLPPKGHYSRRPNKLAI